MADASNRPTTAKIIIGDREIELPVRYDNFGYAAIETTSLFGKHQLMTFDEGYASTARTESKITFIDGDKGVLLYRGYPIEQLAEQGTFLESAYLLLNGELPTKNQLDAFNKDIVTRMPLADQMYKQLERLPRNAHPMTVIASMVMGLTAVHGTNNAPKTPEDRYSLALDLIAKIPTIVAAAHRHTTNQPIVQPTRKLGYTENFLRMCFADADSSYEPNPIITRAMDVIFILHADHEQNASTSTVRMSGSTGVEPYGAIAAGVMALWGPAHGGANEAVLEMLERIGTLDKVPEFIESVKNKGADSAKLMGFGHRVYKNHDPRATIIKADTDKVLAQLGITNPKLDIAKKLEEVALNDEYFKSKKLYPNVDFYSGITLSALGFGTKMFTPLFALARATGWIAQWKEMTDAPSVRIDRPRQLYMGANKRDYLPLDRR